MANQPLQQTAKTEPNKIEKVILSKEPQKAMQEMMQIIDSLRTTMMEETEAVRENDTKAFIRLQDKKMEAATHYQDGVSQMIARKDEMRTAPESMKEQLAKMREEFMDIAKENMQMLERMRNGMQRLSDRIMKAAKKEAENSQKFVYGAHGKLEGSGKASIGVNERA